jgi:fructuronate reductase
MRVVSARRSDSGQPLVIEDPLADAIAERVGGRTEPRRVVEALLSMREIFSADLAGDGGLSDLLADHLERLIRDGAQLTAQRVGG